MDKKIKVLLVDDLKRNLLALESLLESEEDLETVSALGGQKALEVLLDHEFALALIDVQMPDINGFELAKLIRGTKKHKDLPIIFVTAHAPSEESLFEGYESGAIDFLFKPVNPVVLRSKVQVLAELYRKNKILAEMSVKARAGSESKSRFLAHMSHEMRTPLTAIQGFVELLEEGSGPEERAQAAEVIRRNAHYLVEIIDDILDLAKVEANKLDITSAPFEPAELVKDVYASLRARAEEKRLDFKLVYESRLPETVIGDSTRARQALINILSNAIKYTDEGSVSLIVGFEKTDGKGVLSFCAKDTGRGISKSEHGRIFEPFYRAQEAKSLEGSGLGLSLTKRLVNAMGGDISFDSRVGEGSEFELFFSVDLPANVKFLDHDVDKEFGLKETKSGKGEKLDCHALIVDDNKDLRNVAEGFMRSYGGRASTAEDGAQAIAVYKRLLRDKQPVDMVLMDLQMPVMDGYEASQKLREEGFKGPIIAFSAHVMDADRDKCWKVGCSDFISKPISKELLMEKIRYHCRQARQGVR